MTTLQFDWLGHDVVVEIDSHFPVAQIAKSLSGYFRLRRPPPDRLPDLMIRRLSRPHELNGLPLKNTGSRFPLYFGEEGLVQECSDARTIVYQPSRGRVYVITRHCVEYHLCGEELEDRLSVARLVRERLIQNALAAGAIKLHAAAVQLDECGVLLIGPSGTGKTSLLLRLLEHPNSSFVGGDRVVVFGSADQLSIAGTPIALQIGENLAKGTSGLLESVATLQMRHLPRSPRSSSQAFAKLSFMPSELCQALGKPLVPITNLRFVLVPSLGETQSSSIDLTTIDRGERRSLILNELLNVDPAFPAAVIGSTDASPSGTVLSQLQDVQWLRISADYQNPRIAGEIATELARLMGRLDV